MQKGNKHKKETRQKMSEIARTRDNTNRIKALPKGKQHWNYSENPTKLTLHKRLYRKHGKASDRKCVDCGNQARDWSNTTGVYTDDIKDYEPRCRKCHIKFDGNNKNGINVWKNLDRDSKGKFKSNN